MEPRYRTILPIAGILLVIIIAFVAFFITRRVDRLRVTNAPSPTPALSSRDLLLPADSGTPKPVFSSGSQKPVSPVSSLREVPRTGIEESANQLYTTVIDDTGFRDTNIRIAKDTKLMWLNLGNKAHAVVMNGISSGQIAPNTTFTYTFDQNKQYKVMDESTSTSQTISVQ